MPSAGLEAWMQTPAEERKAQEDALKMKWDAWMADHKAMMTGATAGVGKTKRILPQGAALDAKNDIMMYSIVEGESHDAVAKAFEGHPHLEIPGSWIDVSTANFLPGMEGM